LSNGGNPSSQPEPTADPGLVAQVANLLFRRLPVGQSSDFEISSRVGDPGLSHRQYFNHPRHAIPVPKQGSRVRGEMRQIQ